MSALEVERRYAQCDYLEFERESDIKHELIHGRLYAMAGATRKHNLVSTNTTTALNTLLRERACEVYQGDMRVFVEETKANFYPDVVVVCGEPLFFDEDEDTLLNPLLIVETLSPSTEKFDQGAKFAHYRRIASLQEYVMIRQDRVFVMHYARYGENWMLTELTDLNDTLRLPSLGIEIALRELYAKVRLPHPAALPLEEDIYPQ